jgi:hypothetical protein
MPRPPEMVNDSQLCIGRKGTAHEGKCSGCVASITGTLHDRSAAVSDQTSRAALLVTALTDML